uniref:Perilipin-3 n=1 Tax=Panagrellus redivivus TaxID=6233 RepID=A0A7E4VA04_PANRE
MADAESSDAPVGLPEAPAAPLTPPSTPPPVDAGAQAHFDYFKQWYDYLNDYQIVKTAKAGYDAAKHSCSLAESTLTRVENGVNQGIQDVARPGYVNYVYPTADKLVDYYSKGVDNTRSAVDRTKSAAVHTGALSLGLAIVTAQMGLIATTSATNVLLSSLIYTKEAGIGAINGLASAERVVESRVREALQQTQQLAKIPADKAAEHANNFLDVANGVFDRLLRLEPQQEPTESSLTDRIKYLSHRVAGGLRQRADDVVIDPVKSSVALVVDKLNEKLLLADYIRQQREWVTEKAGNLSRGALQIRDKIETEARNLQVAPEELLVRSIKKTSHKLNDNFSRIREQQSQLFQLGSSPRFEAATSYIHQLDESLAKADNIYQIRDEVIVEAKSKLREISQWTSSFLVSEQGQQSPAPDSPAEN